MDKVYGQPHILFYQQNGRSLGKLMEKGEGRKYLSLMPRRYKSEVITKCDFPSFQYFGLHASFSFSVKSLLSTIFFAARCDWKIVLRIPVFQYFSVSAYFSSSLTSSETSKILPSSCSNQECFLAIWTLTHFASYF